MDFPPDKLRTLRSWELSKKWNLVCDQRRMQGNSVVTDPAVYIEKLSAYFDKKTLKKKKKLLGDETSTSILKHIEISLRQNTIDWVISFLEQNQGLRVIVDYMKQLQDSFASFNSSTANSSLSCLSESAVFVNNAFDSSLPDDSKWYKRQSAGKSTKANKNIGDVEDDIHVCVACLRAMLNTKIGLQKVFTDPEAIYCIVRSILHPSLRTKTYVVELLNGFCYLKDGHDLVVKAFDRFREVRLF